MFVAKYTKKPYVVEAVLFKNGDFTEWADWLQEAFYQGKVRYLRGGINKSDGFTVKTLEGVMEGRDGYYIIRGVEGEVYPCRGDIFEKTYQKVEV